MSALSELVAASRKRVERARAELSEAALSESLASRRGPTASLRGSIRGPGLSLIAEFKRASPSAGGISPGAEVESVVSAYERGGAAALSVLTEPERFGGSLDDLRRAAGASRLPVLRKDFIVDSYQLVEAAASGASAALLIVAALSDEELAELLEAGRRLGLDLLVEVHDERELERAATLGCELIGINNRDLATLEVDTATTTRLAPLAPSGVTLVSESGWASRDELSGLGELGVDAVLVGEALMREGDPERAVRSLAGR